MIIRRANASDLPGLNRLLEQVLMVHHNGRPDLFKSGAKKYTDEELLTLLADEGRPVFAAVDDSGTMLGYCFCIFQQHLNNNILTDIRTLYIDDLCVDDSARGKGVATALFRHVTAVAKAAGAKFITLNVWEGNSARNFYDKMGMKPRKTTLELPLEETVC